MIKHLHMVCTCSCFIKEKKSSLLFLSFLYSKMQAQGNNSNSSLPICFFELCQLSKIVWMFWLTLWEDVSNVCNAGRLIALQELMTKQKSKKSDVWSNDRTGSEPWEKSLALNQGQVLLGWGRYTRADEEGLARSPGPATSERLWTGRIFDFSKPFMPHL